MAPTSRRVAHTPTAIKHNNRKVDCSLNKKCMLCGHKQSQNWNGLLYTLHNVTVHYFCVMLSLRTTKNGSDKDGIFGYLLTDIKAEITRGSRLTCVYCKKKGATLSCSDIKCPKLFHLPCGLIHGSMHHYFQTFNSFCQQHRVQPVIDKMDLHTFASPTVDCAICNDYAIPSTSPTSIWVPCCITWFHRDCVQDLALRKGYFIECPKCGNVDKFKSRILTLGIYIPSRYATWKNRSSLQKILGNSFKEGSERTMQCDAERCLCPHAGKRNYQNEFGWQLVLCNTCGYKQTHILCSFIKINMKWTCVECQTMIANRPKRRLQLPLEGNVVGITSVMGKPADARGNIIPRQPYIPGYVKILEHD